MANASTSYSIQDHSPSYAMQMRLNNKLFNETPISSRCFGEFDLDPNCSFNALEGCHQQLAGTGNASYLEKESYPASLVPLSSAGTAAISSEIAQIIQGRVISVPTSHHLSIGHESIGLPGDFCSLDLNEFTDCGDIRLYSQDRATAAVPPPQRHEWVEGSTSYTTSRDRTMPTTVSVDFERTLGQRSYTVSTCTETSAGEGNFVECPQPFQHEQSSHSSQPVASNGTSEGFYRPWILEVHGAPWTSTSDVILPLSSGAQMETTEKTMSPSLQTSTSKKSRLYSQTVESDRIRDSAAVQNFRHIVDVSKVLGPRPNHFVQQEQYLSMSTSRDLHEGHQPRQCRIRGKVHQFSNENLNRLRLKQKSLAKPLPRKYQRRRILCGIGTKYEEVDRVSTPRDHVQRERKRRDIMTSKVAALDLLLPKSSKVSVVYDAIQLVQKLQRDVKDLQKKFHEAKLLGARRKQSRDPWRVIIPKSIDYNMDTSGIVIKRAGTYMKQVAIRTQPTRGASGKSRPMSHLPSMTQQCSGGSNVPGKFVEFRVHLDDKVTVQEAKIWKCRCRLDYLRRMTVVMEDFQLDLTSCNIIKLSDYFICSMGLRARTRADTISAAQFAVRLQSVVDVDTTSEEVRTRLQNAKIPETGLESGKVCSRDQKSSGVINSSCSSFSNVV